jgi:DNA-binding GntR family transcriptional regulator
MSQTEIVRGLEAWFEEHREQVQAVFEVRQVLENHAVHLAAQRASPDIVAQMRDTLAEMRSYTERGMLLNATHADRKFHGLLYHASGNRFLEILGDGIVATLFEARHSILRVPGRAELSLKEHQAIVEAIAARDPERACSAMRQHVSNTVEALLALEA